MRATVLFTLSLALIAGAFGLPGQAVALPQNGAKSGEKKEPTPAGSPSPAAERTLSKALKAKVSGSFTDVRLGDILKEFAAQVEMSAEVILLWTYGKDFPYAQKVTYSCKSKPLEEALDELFKKTGTLGYVVVSKDGDRHDGWVLLTTTGERGAEKEQPKASAAEEADAAAKLTLAKKLIDGGKDDQAKTVLTFIVKRYPAAKAAAEAKELLAKLGK